MDEIPQPFAVKLESAKPAEAPPVPAAGEASKYLRETCKWIVGGIVATAGAVLAGSSLTNLGSLDPREDLGRLALAVVGVVLGFVSIGWLMAKALGVLQVRSISLERLKDAPARSEWAKLRDVVVQEFGLTAEGADSLAELLKTPAQQPVPAIDAMLPYLYVRSKFEDLVWWLPWTVAGAALGFGLFAWAANPPERKAPPQRPPMLIVNWP